MNKGELTKIILLGCKVFHFHCAQPVSLTVTIVIGENEGYLFIFFEGVQYIPKICACSIKYMYMLL